jgi:hypothetical protein
MDLSIQLREEDPAAEVGMVPAYRLQAAHFRVGGGGQDELCETLLISFPEHKAEPHGMFTMKWSVRQDADAIGLLNTEQDSADLMPTVGRIASTLHLAADLAQQRGLVFDREWALRDAPNCGDATSARQQAFFDNVVHGTRGHITHQMRF